MRETGGDVIVVHEAAIARAYEFAKTDTAISASTTGTAGLAGLLAEPSQSAAVVFSGSNL
jgi:threonine dehydratase